MVTSVWKDASGQDFLVGKSKRTMGGPGFFPQALPGNLPTKRLFLLITNYCH
jgi:hypothetical protein